MNIFTQQMGILDEEKEQKEMAQRGLNGREHIEMYNCYICDEETNHTLHRLYHSPTPETGPDKNKNSLSHTSSIFSYYIHIGLGC
jgi:hypothetical protein